MPILLVLSLVLAQTEAQNATNCNSVVDEEGINIPVPLNYFIIMFLICLSALFSGLTLGLLGLDKMGLQIVIGGDDLIAAKYARAILPIRENGNLLLCTLLLGNVSVNSMLSILMANMTSGVVGFLSSTILIVIFGEIIPQASCSRHALKVGYYSLPVVKIFICIFFLASYPLGYMLDKLLGEDIGTIHTVTELRKMLQLHVQHGAVDVDSGGLMDGALRYRDMEVKEVMTPAKDVFMLSIDERFDYRIMSEIFKAGCSRIPVYGKDRNELLGLILVKDLLFIDSEDEIPIRSFFSHFGRIPPQVWPDQKLGEILKIFRQGRSHMAIVRDVDSTGPGDPFYTFRGIITLEDIIEEILGQEINDETDVIVDSENRVHEVSTRDVDFARMMLLQGKTDSDELSKEEIQAISTHLLTNVPELKRIFEANRTPEPEEVASMLRSCNVFNVDRASSNDMVVTGCPLPSDVIYSRGSVANFAVLVLSGKIIIHAGIDCFRSEVGPWALLGCYSFTPEGKVYTPDFTAYVASEKARYVKITNKFMSMLVNRQGDASQVPKGVSHKKQGKAVSSINKPTKAASNMFAMHDSHLQDAKYMDADFITNPLLMTSNKDDINHNGIRHVNSSSKPTPKSSVQSSSNEYAMLDLL